MEGVGNNQMWGFTPALDLQQSVPATTSDPLNILLVGTCDIRHVLKTVCFARRHSVRSLRFFVFDETMECLARHILLMSIASESDINIPERGQLLLELHGNALLRSKTRSYLADKATEFMKSLTSSPELLNRFDLSQLKHKERDALEDVFRFWKAAKTTDFDMSKLRETRNRHHFKDRYDNRFNLIDWDYTMRIQPEASILHFLHYSHFRNSGLAYELRECEYSEPNFTLASRVEGKSKARGEPVSVRGYWGDIVCGPFAAFAVEADEPRLFEKASVQHKHSDIDVAEYNMISMLAELETGVKYVMPAEKKPVAESKKSEATLEVIDEDESESDSSSGKLEAAVEPNEIEAQIMRGHVEIASAGQTVNDVADKVAKIQIASVAASKAAPVVYSVTLLHGDFNGLMSKSKFQHFFHRIVLGAAAPTKVSAELNAICAKNCLITLDSSKYLYLLKDEQKTAFVQNLDAQASDAGWKHFNVEHGDGHRSYVCA